MNEDETGLDLGIEDDDLEAETEDEEVDLAVMIEEEGDRFNSK